MNDSCTNITVSIADRAILPLVKRFFHAQGMRSQAARNDEVIIARQQHLSSNPIIAALRLCPVDNAWLLRSMSVDKKFQRQGIGLSMLRQIGNSLADKKCYCFPYSHLEGFYHSAGFEKIDLQEADIKIQSLYQQYLNSGKDIILMQYLTD